MLEKLKSAVRHVPAILGFALLIGAIYVVWREFRHLKLADIQAALAAISTRSLAAAFLWTVISYGILTFYDRLGTMFAGHKVSYRRVAFASFCAYALSHNLGFAAVSGAAVRYRLYAHWGLTPGQIAKVVAFCSLTFGLGGMVLGGIILFWEPDAVPFFGKLIPPWGMYAIGAGLWLVVAGYVGLSRFVGTIRLMGAEIGLPGWRMSSVQVVLATADVAITAAIVYQLLPPTPGLTFVRFLGVYVSSYTAGLAANVPGGLGVFDSAMLLGLEPYMDPAHILGAVVVFRLYYYIIPLFLAGALFAGNEILLRGGALVRSPGLTRRAQSLSGWSEPDFAVAASTGAVALCGALLLALGVLDQRPDFSWIDPDFAEAVADAGQFIPSLIGGALIVLAIGLSQRVTLAWGATLVLLLAASGFTLAQGTVRWVPAVLMLATLLVAPFRDAYYRHARLMTGPLRPGTALPLLALIGCVLTLASFEPHFRRLADNSLFDVVLSPEIANGTRITIALLVVWGLAALWRLSRPSRGAWLPGAGEGRLRYASLGGDPPAQADGVVLGETGRAAIPFRRIGRVMLGLGDPAGAVSDRVSAIWNLRDLAQQEGLDPAVYRAGPALLKVYEDLGLAALPLGRDGLLSPEAADTPGDGAAFLCCVAERDLSLLVPLLPQLAERRQFQDAAE